MASRSKKSKKRSAASFRSPSDFTVFLDATFGRLVVADALRATGAAVETHDAHFAQGTPDDEWLTECGRRNWLVVSQDQHIRYRKNEIEAVRQANVRLFVFTGGSVTGQQAGETLAVALPRIYRLATRNSPPFVAKITRGGDVEMYEDFSRRRRT
jgi:hypothetical protein